MRPKGNNIALLQGQIVEVQKKREQVTADYEISPSNAVASVLMKMEAKEKELLGKLETEKAATIGATPINDAYSEFLKTLHADWTNIETRLRLRELIRTIVEKLVVDVDAKSYQIFLKNGAKPIKIECFPAGCRIDGVEYVLTTTLEGPLKPKAITGPRKAKAVAA